MTDSDGNEKSEHIKEASDSFREGATGILSGLTHTIRAFRRWFNKNPIIGSLLVGIASPLLTKSFFNLVDLFYVTFYGKTVYISDDILLTNLPLPVGLSIYLLFTLWVVTSVLTYLRLADLRQRVEALESG